MKKIIITLVAIVGLIGGGLLISQMNVSNEESVDYAELYDVGDLPLTVDQIPFSYELADAEGKKVLNISYTNNSSEAIMTLSVHLQLKTGEQPVNVKLSTLTNPGETSNVTTLEVPADIKVEDIKVLKYMISLQKGIYMEYDASLNQYNWS